MKKVAIVGSGVVGQASGKGLSKKGLKVIFVDIDPKVLKKLREEGREVLSVDKLGKKAHQIGTFLLSVPTPSVFGKINLEYIKSATRCVGQAIKNSKDRKTIVFRSTLPPGTTRKILIPILEEESGMKAGRDFGVCMNPEYLREVKAEEDFDNPRLILIGALDDESFEGLKEIYASFESFLVKASLEEAEMQKYVHNIFNAVKIAFFNEMRTIADELAIEADKIFELVTKSAEASWNPSYGTKNFGPFAGMCLPKDTQAFLSWAREELGQELLVLKAAIESNDRLTESNSKKIEKLSSGEEGI